MPLITEIIVCIYSAEVYQMIFECVGKICDYPTYSIEYVNKQAKNLT